MSDLKTTDPAFAATVDQSTAPLTIRRGDGTLLGYFTPALSPQYETFEDELPPEELRRRIEDRTSKRFTSVEVWAKLQELKKCTK